MNPNNQTQPTPEASPDPQPVMNNQVDIPKELDFNEDNLGPGTEEITDTSPSVESAATPAAPASDASNNSPFSGVISPVGAPTEKKKPHLATLIALGAVVVVAIAIVVFVVVMS